MKNEEIKTADIRLPSCEMCYWVCCGECGYGSRNGYDSEDNLQIYCGKHRRNFDASDGCSDGILKD